MGLRSAIAAGLDRASKALAPAADLPPAVAGGGVPPEIAASEAAQQMPMDSPFGPGTPLRPFDGYSRTPRSMEYEPAYNIATRPRLHEAVSFSTLKGLIRNYDVARLCIRHRIASLRSLDYKLVAATGYDGDVSGAIDIGNRVLEYPDGVLPFRPWLAKYMRGVLSYDAGTLYRMRNRAGRVCGLKVVDGTTIAPLLDYWGDRPEPPAESYVQFVNGLPWNWLTSDDLIYVPYDPQDDSPYGTAPIEDILLNSNLDIRFQVYFLQRFTEGNMPAAFASAPETWTPDEVEQFQEYWDAAMYGDQAGKHQIKWIPGGSSFAWTNEKEFTENFSLFLTRKTCAAFAVVPSDLGFTETVNRSSGESQADVQHRVGDLPMARHIQDILTAFLQRDMGLPLRFMFDLGEEQDDRVKQAQADTYYIDRGVVGTSEIREMRYGLPEPEGRPVPRFVYTTRSGPIPLASLFAVAGEIDPATGAPVPGAPLPHQVFGGAEGVIPSPPIKTLPLAEQEYGRGALPPAPPKQPPPPPDPAAPASKAETAGITAATGTYGNPLASGSQDNHPDNPDDDQDNPGELTAAAKAELGAFSRYTRARVRSGEWRDFQFRHVPASRAAGLNATARGQVTVAVAKAIEKSTADAVFHQLTEDYPKAALDWIHHAAWEGPLIVPFAKLNMSDRSKWRASHEPDRVKDFAGKIKQRLAKGKDQLKKPAVVVFEPATKKALIVDGHHRTLGAEEAGEEGVLAWVGHVDRKDGPWIELHDLQFTRDAGSAAGAGDDVAADQVGKQSTPAAFLLLRASDGDKARYLLQKRRDGTWGLPGGHAYPGEAPWDTAVREAREELGCLPQGITPAGRWRREGCCTYLVDLPAVFHPSGGDDETAGWGWFRRREVRQLVLQPSFRRTWKQLDHSHPLLGAAPAGRAVKEASGYDLGGRSGMISLDLPPGLVPVVPGGVGDQHVTVVFLGDDVSDEAFTAACGRARLAAQAVPGPLPGTVSGVGAFPAKEPGGKIPAWAAAAIPGAHQLRTALADLNASQFTDWQPHVTMAYLDPGDPLPAPLDPVEVTFTHLSVHRSDGLVRRYPFGGGGGGEPQPGDTGTCPCGTPVVYDEGNGWQHADGSISHDDGESVSHKMSTVAKCQFCPACDSDLDQSGNCTDWAERGERARQAMGIDGTAGDAQDVPHKFVSEGRHTACAACGLAEGAWPHPQGSRDICPCGTPVVWDAVNGWHHANGSASHDDGESVSDKMRAVAKAGDPSPKGRRWPGWDMDLAAAAYWGRHLRDQVRATLTDEVLAGVARVYIKAHPGQDGKATGKRQRDAAALAWLSARLATGGPDLSDVADGLTADGVAIGGISARSMVSGEPADRAGWKPGLTGAAVAVAEATALSALLASARSGAGHDAAGEMTGSYYALVSRILAGWDPSVAAFELEDMLAAAVADTGFAEAVTVTQVTALSGKAALAYYLANSVDMVSWVDAGDAKVCPRCLENAASPVRAGTAFPSGDTSPPAHPRCRCALVPEWARPTPGS